MRDTQVPTTEPNNPSLPSQGTRVRATTARALIRLTCGPLIWLTLAGGLQADTLPTPDQERIREVVTRLASPEFAGRSGAGGKKAAEFLVDQFQALKLEPAFDGSYVQWIPGDKPDTYIGRNVAASLRGSDPALRDQWIIVAAHFDHLGIRNGKLYPGADDNASGVAMMLETARCIVNSPTRPKRSIMFIGFDLEEFGLFGSRYFVAHPPVPLDHISLFITADMIGRALGGVCLDHVFVIGTEHIPVTRDWIAGSAKTRPLKVGLLGSDLLVLNRSDYGPFRSSSIPYLFFTTGENPKYHTPNDLASTLNYTKAAAISGLILDVTRTALDAPKLPRWNNQPDHPLAEAETIRDVLKILWEHQAELKIGAVPLYLMESTIRLLDGVATRGKITPEERAKMIQAARVVLFTVF